MSIDEGLRRAMAQGKMVFMTRCGSDGAPLCDGCADEAVSSVLAENYVPILLEVNDPELLVHFEGREGPLMAVFEGGVLIDLQDKCLTASEICIWLKALSRLGSLERIRNVVGSRPADVPARMRLADLLVEAGDYGSATSEYLWLWNRAKLNRSLLGFRGSFLCESISRLVEISPAARDEFSRIRGNEPEETSRDDDMLEWILLNRALGEQERTLEWWENVWRSRTVPSNRMLERMLEFDLVPILAARHRWREAGLLLRDPQRRVSSAERMLSAFDQFPPLGLTEQELSNTRIQLVERVRAMMGELIRMLRAADRDPELKDVIVSVTRFDSSPEMLALIQVAVSGH